jgi:hypothetical protein
MTPIDKFVSLRRSYKFEQTFQTNISANYLADSGSNWGVWEMLRESIQNMMDEAEYQADTNGGELLDYCKVNIWPTCIELIDKGRGVDWQQIFLIGESGKRGSHYRGQKGEGEGLSFLVAARKGIAKTLYSKDWLVRARLDDYLGGTYKVLAFDLYRTDKPIAGTIWRYDLTDDMKQYTSNLGNYFPQLSRREQRRQEAEARKQHQERMRSYKTQEKRVENAIKRMSTGSKKMIITPDANKSARLFVRGIYVKEIHALFSYNLQNVEINRDRSMVDEWQMLTEIQKAFNSSDLTFKQAVKYWQNAEDKVGDAGWMEYKTIINFNDNRDLMLKAFKKAFGKKACMFTDKAASLDAESIGFRVIDLHPHVRDTARELNITTDRNAVGYVGNILPMKQINSTTEALLSKLAEIGKAFGFKDYQVVPSLKVLGTNNSAYGWHCNGVVYLMKHTLEGDRLTLLETYIHECGHAESGATDATREFTQWFETMLIKALTGKHDGVRGLIDELMQI